MVDVLGMLASGKSTQATGRQKFNMATASPRMAPSSAKPVIATTPDAAMPSETIRTAVSFLIFVHLFALLVGVLGSDIPSELESALARLGGLREYRQLLAMEQSYAFFFTRGNDPGGELDIDYRLEATIKRPDGEPEVVQLPTSDVWPRQRFHRYQRLAAQMAEYASEGSPEPQKLEVLAQVIAGALLRSQARKAWTCAAEAS